jgi:hypothetical protein
VTCLSNGKLLDGIAKGGIKVWQNAESLSAEVAVAVLVRTERARRGESFARRLLITTMSMFPNEVLHTAPSTIGTRIARYSADDLGVSVRL